MFKTHRHEKHPGNKFSLFLSVEVVLVQIQFYKLSPNYLHCCANFIYLLDKTFLFLFFSFLLNLLGWHWLTKLYRFQVHSSTTHHHHPKSSLLPSAFILPIPSPTSPQQSLHCCPCSWVLFLFRLIRPPLPPPEMSTCSLSMILSIFCLLVQFVH